MKGLNDNLIKVLLVDDDEAAFVLTKNLFDDFKDNCYRLEWTNNGGAALASMKTHDHDIYFVDFGLGAYNGLEILREAVTAGCTAPIILTTAEGDDDVDFKAMEAGAADYLVKGQFEAPLLERVIRYSLQHARSMEKMQTSEEKFRSVIQSASDAIFLVNNEGEIILWNNAAEKIFGYTESEIVGQSATLLMGEKYAKKLMDVGVQKTMADVLPSLTGNVIQAAGKRRDGSEFPLEMSGSIWKTGKGFFYTAIIRDITERKRAGESLKESEERYRDLFENANDIIYLHDLQGNFISINSTGVKIFGYTRTEALRLNIKDIVAPEHLEFAFNHIKSKIGGGDSASYEIDCIKKDGRRVSFEINSRVIIENAVPVAIQGIARDITDRKLAEEERDRLYNVSNDLLATMSFDGTLLHLNPAWNKILGYETGELLGKTIYEISHEDDRKPNRANLEKLRKGENISVESRLVCKDGSYRWILWNSTPLPSEQILYAVGRNITERKEVEKALQHNALFDILTNLPNRTQFMNHLKDAISKYRKNPNPGFAVLFLDLDRFKIINDGLGHLIGDKLLVAIAERIKGTLRPGDVVARIGGDEFTLLIHNVAQVSDATNVAERIQRNLAKPFRLDNYEVFSSASIGIAIADETKRKPEDFLRDADSAMYRAKDSGKARFELFDCEMHNHNLNLLQVETDLRRAIERGEFSVYYQPIVNLVTGATDEFESLIRWEHPTLGLISPDKFIPIAEETGLIIQIGEWVLEESCRQMQEWRGLFPARKLTVSVNLSAKQLMHPNLIKRVKEIIKKSGLPFECLKLEVTESVVMDNPELALEVLSELCAFGVRLSTDDFGTGYSSLSYLHRFPFERLKIDRSFIGKMDTDVTSVKIVRTILTLAENLNLEVVAEGVETEAQFLKLRELGCHLAQGYLFSKPVTALKAEEILSHGLNRKIPPILLNGSFSLDGDAVFELANIQ